jgi:hypothetical protein
MSKPRSFLAPTLKHLIDQDINADIVERYVPARPRPFRQDWLGFADVIGFDQKTLWVVQIGRAQDLAEHVRKMADLPVVHELMQARMLQPVVAYYGWRDCAKRKDPVPEVTILGPGDLDKPPRAR